MDQNTSGLHHKKFFHVLLAIDFGMDRAKYESVDKWDIGTAKINDSKIALLSFVFIDQRLSFVNYSKILLVFWFV